MQIIRKSNERGQVDMGWLQSYHSFSFGEYYDPAHMGFGPLRVINEDWVKPETGFGMHGHKNMEIITYVLEGELSHQDNIGNGDVIRPGDIQIMSAGKGILHSEMNKTSDQEVHLLQIWIMPNELGTRAGYQQKAFDPALMQNRLQLVVSPDGEDGSLLMKQDAKLLAGKLDQGKVIPLQTEVKRKYWLQIARGQVDINGKKLDAGDAMSIADEAGAFDITAVSNAEVLVFDLPQ